MDVQEGDNSWEHAMEYLAMVREAQYHTQIVLMLYEDTYKPENDPDRFRVSINFSPGTAACQRKVNEKLTAMTGLSYRYILYCIVTHIIIIYNVYCTIYSIHSLVYTIQHYYTMYDIHYTICTMQCIIYN